MTDELLRYYQQELTYVHKQAAEFAQAFPKIAGRLQVGADAIKDPHVERLIEAFAFMNARIRHKLDDDFPEIAEAMLQVLYPHYLTPIPSAAIVQFQLDRQQGELTSAYRLERGAEIETEPVDGEPCRFRTCYPVSLLPLDLTHGSFKGHPFAAPRTRYDDQARSVVRLEFETISKQIPISQLQIGSIPIFLNGPSQYIYDLHELLLNNTIVVAVADGPDDRNPVMLPADCLKPVGFERNEALVDYPSRSFWGYRLLSEFFAFPHKFLFVELSGLTPAVLSKFGKKLNVFFYLNRHVRELERNVSRDTFRLGCTPIVNLFKQRAEPIRLTQHEAAYHVVPDARRPIAHEIFSIDRVASVRPNGDAQEFQPFYSVKHGGPADMPRAFWYANRRQADHAGGQTDNGTELYLTLVDLDLNLAAPADATLDVETTCMNRDLPHRLPFGGGEPRLQLTVGAPVTRIECLTAPTPTLRPWLRHGVVWRLISHLSLNHLSLVDYENGADALREILKLYDFKDSTETRTMIDGLKSVRGNRVVGRVADKRGLTFCRGVEAVLHLDEAKFIGGGVFLFASVLERFLGLYCSINSFTKTVVTTTKREGPLKKWPPRASEQTLL